MPDAHPIKPNPVNRLALNPTGKHLVVEFTRRLTVTLHDNPTPASRNRIGAVLGEVEPRVEGAWRVFDVHPIQDNR